MAPAATKSTVSDFRATLEEYGALTRAALQEWLPKEEPKRYLYDLVADYPARGGKMLRPCLCLATAVAFGANRQDALRAAVSIELLHNALLVHDDIQDESDERRGQPTLHAIHGWQRDNAMDLDDGDYLEMVLKKTCWLTSIYPLRIGALIGTRRAHLDLAPFLRFGFYLGAAFQIQDDVLNLIGDDRYGKEINGDILEGKRSLMLLHLLREARPALRKQLETFLAKPREKRAAAEVSRIRSAMERYGSIAYAQEIARGLADAARHEFDHAFQHVPDTRDRRFIEALIRYVIERET
jgi:geranylgeranyl diphosphate synthase type II